MKSPNRQLALLFLILFVVMMGFGIVIPVLPFLARELGASSFEMGLITAFYALAQFLCAAYWGSVSDRYGRKPVLILGLAGLGLSFFAMAFATSLPMLLTVRTLGGILASSPLPAAQAFAADISGPSERAENLARTGASMMLGFIFGPVIGGALAPFGPHAPFWVGGGLAILTAIGASIVLIEPREHAARTGGRVTLKTVAHYAAKRPIAPYFWLAFAVMFAHSSVFAMAGFFIADRFGGGATETGLAFIAYGLVSAVIQGLIIGRLVGRFREERVILAGLLIGGAGFLGLSFAKSMGQMFFAMPLVAAGLALVRPTITGAVSLRTPLGQGVTMGIQGSFDSLGRMLGPLWAGFIYAYGIQAPFWSAALVHLLAFVFVLPIFMQMLSRTPADPPEPVIQPAGG